MYVTIDVCVCFLHLPLLNLPHTNNHSNTYAISQQTCFIVTHSFSILGADGSPPSFKSCEIIPINPPQKSPLGSRI